MGQGLGNWFLHSPPVYSFSFLLQGFRINGGVGVIISARFSCCNSVDGVDNKKAGGIDREGGRWWEKLNKPWQILRNLVSPPSPPTRLLPGVNLSHKYIAVKLIFWELFFTGNGNLCPP